MYALYLKWNRYALLRNPNEMLGKKLKNTKSKLGM